MNKTIKIQGTIWATVLTCLECDRKFDMTNENDVTEYSFGHDCEA